MTIRELTDAMIWYNQQVAPGGECAAMQDYIEDVVEHLGRVPWKLDQDLDIEDLEPALAAYWLEVAAGHSSDYDSEGGRIDG